MSYIFKKGDVVRYKKEHSHRMLINGHGESDHRQEFVVESTKYPFGMGNVPLHEILVKFEGDGPNGGVLAHRIELVSLAKDKPEGNFAWGVFLANGKLDKVFKTREEARIYKSKWLQMQMTIKKIKYEIV